MGPLRSALHVARRHRVLALWLVYLFAPVDGWGLFDGRPLGALSMIAIAVVAWLWFARRRLPFAAIVALALGLKLALGATLLLPHGFDARYFANPELREPAERGSEPAASSFTRVDRELRFGVPGARELPQYFLNDVLRFNFRNPPGPDRATLPVSASWHGLLRVPDAGPQLFYLRASGATVTLTIGETRVATLTPSDKVWTGTVALRAGYEPIVVTASMPQGVARHVEAGRIIAGREVPLGDDVFRRAASPLRHSADDVLRMLALALDFALCATLAFASAARLREAWRGLRSGDRVHAGLVLAWAIVIGDVLLFVLPLAPRAIVLSGGDDWLTYESFARDIAINGIWMLQGAPLGQGQPFYFQPFYPYFVAACHWLAGDSLIGVYFVQRVLAGATAIALWRLTAVMFGERIGCAGLVASVLLVYTKFEPWTRVLLSETLFIPLIAILCYAIARSSSEDPPRPWRAALAGAIGGIATLTRTSLLIGWGLVLPALALALRRRRRGWTMLGVFAVTLGLVTSLAAVRNFVVSHKFVATATSGSYVLRLGNPPKTPLVIPEERRAEYERTGVDANMQQVLEFVRQRPGEFLAGWLDKAAYSLGWFGALLPDTPTAWFYVLAWIIALAGLVLLPRTPSATPPAARAVPLLMALSIFATLVAFLPHVYGDRMILPFYVLLVPYAALALERLHRWLARRELAGALGWIAAAAAIAGIHVFGDRTVLVPLGAFAVAALCVARPPELSARATLPFVPFAIAMLAIYFAKPELAEASTRAHLLVLAVALVAGVHVRSRRGIVVVATAAAAAGLALALAKLAGGAGVPSLSSAARNGLSRFADLSTIAALVGPGLLVLALAARRFPAIVSAAFYAAGAALALAALPLPSTGGTFSWVLIRNVLSVLGVAGALAYALVWLAVAWPGRLRDAGSAAYAVRLLQGAVLGLFVGGQAGAGVASLEVGPALLIAGLLFAAIQGHRHANGDDRMLERQPAAA